MPITCRNRHCPKCQATAAKEWLAEREAELLPVGYFHLVFTLPGPIADIAYHNKAHIRRDRPWIRYFAWRRRRYVRDADRCHTGSAGHTAAQPDRERERLRGATRFRAGPAAVPVPRR